MMVMVLRLITKHAGIIISIICSIGISNELSKEVVDSTINLLVCLLQRSAKKYDVSGIIIAIVLLILKMFLLWVHIDSRKYRDFTNSTMMNYGIWLQLIFLLLISMLFTILGLRKYENKWTLFETYNEIDEEFVNGFHANLYRTEMKKFVCWDCNAMPSLIL